MAFFVMLLTLGIDSAFSIIEAVSTAFYDKFGIDRRRIILVLCIGCCALGLLFCFQTGLQWLDINDNFLGNYSLPIVAMIQSIVFGWLIGSKRFKEIQDSINRRSEFKAGIFWVWSIKIITPLVLIWTLILAFLQLKEKGYGGYATAPLWYAGAGPALLLLALSFVLARMKGKGDDNA